MVKRDWKAITINYADMAGYDDVIENSVCLTQRQIAIIKASLVPQYWTTRWDNLSISRQALLEMMSEIDYRLNLDCNMTDCITIMNCVDNDADYIASSQYQFAQLYKDSLAFEAALDAAYDGSPQSVAPLTPVGVPTTTENNALCFAIAEYVQFYAATKRAWISVQSDWRVALDDLASAAKRFYNDVASGWGKLAGVKFPDIYSCYVSFQVAFDALADEAVLDEFACCLLDNLETVAMSEAALIAAISSCVSSLTGDAQKVACIFENDYELNSFLVFLTGYNVALERVINNEQLDCPCVPAWCYVWLNGDITNLVSLPSYGGVYPTVTIDQVIGTTGVASTGQYATAEITLDNPATITNITVTVSVNQTRPSPNGNSVGIHIDGVSVGSFTNIGDGVFTMGVSGPWVNSAQIQIYVNAPSYLVGDSPDGDGAYSYLQAVTVHGDLPSGMIAPNC